jgi:uncharacterized membrane protein
MDRYGQHRGRRSVIRRLLRGSEWRREVLRTNLWFIPAIEVAGAVVLFAITYTLDRAAYDGVFRVPGWAISGSPDVARTVLTAIAAAVITVIGVVFSIVIVALTLTSTQFGPRMLRTFIRDHGTQITLGTYVATFVYSVLTLGSVGQGDHGDFVPHISVTVTLLLMLVDLAVLIYFLHHIAVQIQLPVVIAGIAADLQQAIELQAGRPVDTQDARYAAVLIANMDGPGGVVAAPRSGYLQYIEHRTLVAIATEVDAVIHLLYRPGHFIFQGNQYAAVWPASAADQVARELADAHVTGPYRTLTQDVSFGVDQLVEICIRALSAAVNDTFTALTCIDWLSAGLGRVSRRVLDEGVYRDSTGRVRLIEFDPSYARMVNRAFDKIRQAARGMPAVLIRLVDSLGSIMLDTTSQDQRAVLRRQADMVLRLAEETVTEPNDLEEIRFRYRRIPGEDAFAEKPHSWSEMDRA